MKRRVFVLAAALALIAALFTLSAFAADNVRYVGNPATAENGDFIKDAETGKYVPKGDGSTPDAPTTLEGAFAYFSENYFNNADKKGETCTIYLVEDVTLTQMQQPGGVKEASYKYVYAEHKHPNNPVKIESAPNTEKFAIVFQVQTAGVRSYLLNGETAFDNVVFRTEKTGFDYATIAARGNKLTIGADVAVDTQNNTKPLGIVGGHINYNYPTGGNKVAYNADVTVLAGDYEFIAALNQDLTVALPAGTSAKLTLGNVTVGTLSATNYKKQTIPANVTVDVSYTGKVEVGTFYPMRLSTDTSQKNAMTFNHFLMPGSSLTYETVDVTKAGTSSLNLYFDPATATAEDSARTLYIAVNGGVDNFSYGSLTDYALANGGTVSCDHAETETAYITEATCAAGGLEFTRCSKCYATLSAIVKGEPDESKHVVDGAAWVEATDGKSMVHKCVLCSKTVESYPVADGRVAVYVSATGDPNGGESAAHPIDTLAHAQDFAAKLADIYYGASDTTTPVTIYVIGKVEITNMRKVSSSELNQFTNCFEESNHMNHPFVFTGADGAERGELHFPTTGNSTMTYLLYGPTTFENLTFSGNIGGHTIVARGFKLVMGEGLEMKDIRGKIENPGSTDHRVKVSDLKLYVVGGWHGSGTRYPLYAEYPYSAPTKDTHADLTVLSGEYWYVGTFNRNVKNVSDSTGTLTIGSPSIIYLSATSTGDAVFNNVTADVHYTGAAQIKCLYLGTLNSDTGSVNYTTRHFFHPGCESMLVVVAYDTYRDAVNLYYYDTLSVKSTADAVIGNKVINETMTFTEYCVAYRGGHTYAANNVCDFCGIKKCTEHKLEWVVDVVPTCTEEGHRYQHCTVCFEHFGEETLDKDENNHDYNWVMDGDSLVSKCSRCGKIRIEHTDPLTNVVYVSDAGFATGGFTARSPINDLTEAFKLAILQTRALGLDQATIYLVGDTTIPLEADGTFLEPEHADITITIMGYGDSAASLKFDYSFASRLEYGLNGPTTFDNIEFSSGLNAKPLYLTARHNHLTIGPKVSADFRRNLGGTDAHSGNLTVVGGCYSDKFGACNETDSHLTIMSGMYRNIIAGSTNRSCGLAGGHSTLELLGNITVRESVFGGSSGGRAGDITIIVDGNVTAGKYIAFGSSNGQKASDVEVYLISGALSAGSFTAATNASSLVIAPVGCANATDIMSNLDSLTVYYNPSNPASAEMYRLVKTSPAVSGAVVYHLIENAVCTGSPDGKHAPNGTGTVVDATCYEDGYTSYTCAYCGETYTETTASQKAAHSFAPDPDMNTAADCIHAGTLASTCQKCGYTKYEINAAAPATGVHTYGDDGVCTVCRYSVAADCAHEHLGEAYTETSKCGTVTKQKCADCGLAITIASTGSHNWGAYTVTVEPTDTAPGVKTRKCKDCGKVETALLYANDTTLATDPVAVDQSGNPVDFAVASSKLTKSEKAALNALLQDTAYGSEVKVSYSTDGTTVTNITYSIPLPDEYSDYQNVKVVVKDDEGNLHAVDFKVEKGYIVFTF